MSTEHAKRPHATKKGPGRYHKSGTPRGSKRDRPGGVGQFGLALRNLNTTRQREALERKRAKSLQSA